MAGFDNEVMFALGERLQASTAQAITLMQQTATDVSNVNFSGNPNGTVAANPSSLSHDPTSGNLWLKATGTGNTGWVLVSGGGGTAAQSFITDTGTSLPTALGVLNIKGQATPNTSGIQTVTSANEVDIRMLTPYTLGDFSFDTSTASSTRSLQVQNTDNTSGTSSARQNILVGGTSAGDPWTQYTIGTARSWSIGADNSDLDSLKFTSTNSATVSPSSGTFIGAMTTTGAFEFGANASGTSDANNFVVFQKNQNGGSVTRITNGTGGTGAYARLEVDSDSCAVGLDAVSSSYTVDPRIADHVILHAFNNSSALDFQSESGIFNFYSTSIGTGTIYLSTSATGAWTNFLQPASAAYLGTSVTNQTGAGATVTVPFDTEMYDQANNFASNTFTVPAGADGKYLCYAQVYVANVTAAMTVFQLDIVAGGVTYRAEIPNNQALARSIEITRTVNLVATNTVAVNLTVSNGAGNTASIAGTSSTGGLRMTYFSVEKVL